MRAKGRDVVLIGHAGHPEVEGTMGRFDARTADASPRRERRDVANLKCATRELAFVTQTTLSVDDTRGSCWTPRAALSRARDTAQGRHLLCHAEPPGRGEEARRQHCDVLVVVGSPRAPIRTACARCAEAPACPAISSTARTTCDRNGSTDKQCRGRHRGRLGARSCWCSRSWPACSSGAGRDPTKWSAAKRTSCLRCRRNCGWIVLHRPRDQTDD